MKKMFDGMLISKSSLGIPAIVGCERYGEEDESGRCPQYAHLDIV